MLSIPYRWTFKTFHKNLWWMWYSIRMGIHNIIRWTPIIWHDEDCDWDSLADVMEAKFRQMAIHFKDHGMAADHLKQYRQTLMCAELIKRIKNNDLLDLPGIPHQVKYSHDLKGLKYLFNRNDLRVNGWQRMLGKEIGRHFMNWWD